MLSSNRAHTIALQPGRRPADGQSFRPVALPALAAAVHVTANAAEAARAKLSAHKGRQFVHEDDPQD